MPKSRSSDARKLAQLAVASPLAHFCSRAMAAHINNGHHAAAAAALHACAAASLHDLHEAMLSTSTHKPTCCPAGGQTEEVAGLLSNRRMQLHSAGCSRGLSFYWPAPLPSAPSGHGPALLPFYYV
jgi:hypothetical protein